MTGLILFGWVALTLFLGFSGVGQAICDWVADLFSDDRPRD